MADAIVTRTTKDGRTLEVSVKRYLPGSWTAIATLDGAYAANGSVLDLTPQVKAQLPGFTHYVLGKSPIALKADEAQILLAAIAAGERADRETPEAQIERLRTERRQLVGDVQSAIEEQADAYEAAHAREDVLAERIQASHEPAIATARAAVQAFDAEHPEIVAAIRAEQQERTERFLRQD